MPALSPIDFAIRPANPADGPVIECLLDRAFGPGRHTKSAYRIREQAGEDAHLAFVAEAGGRLIGSVAFAPIVIAGLSARLLGPLAVEPDLAGKGVGRGLLRHGVDAARDSGHGLIVLVGDPSYYGRVGFVPVPAGRIRFPGPVDPARLMWLAMREGITDDLAGALLPDR